MTKMYKWYGCNKLPPSGKGYFCNKLLEHKGDCVAMISNNVVIETWNQNDSTGECESIPLHLTEQDILEEDLLHVKHKMKMV